jgi:hypothetical protein
MRSYGLCLVDQRRVPPSAYPQAICVADNVPPCGHPPTWRFFFGRRPLESCLVFGSLPRSAACLLLYTNVTPKVGSPCTPWSGICKGDSWSQVRVLAGLTINQQVSRTCYLSMSAVYAACKHCRATGWCLCGCSVSMLRVGSSKPIVS